MLLNKLQKCSTRALVYREGQGWGLRELTHDEREVYKSLSPYRADTGKNGSGPVRFPIGAKCYFGGGRPTHYATYFAECTIRIARKLPLGVFPVQNENGDTVEYPTEPGIYKAYLWKEQVEDAEMAGCEVDVIEGFGWRKLTLPKFPPHPNNKP